MTVCGIKHADGVCVMGECPHFKKCCHVVWDKSGKPMTNEIKIRCDDCKFQEDCVDYGWDGCRKFTPKPSKPMTEQEWLQTCDTEQLAEWLNDKIIICAICDQQKSCGYFINETCHLCPYHEGKNKSWEVWLKQPHNSSK